MPREYPDQSYFPGAKVRLTIRIDEFGLGGLKPLPLKPVKNLKGVKDPNAPLSVISDPLHPGAFLLVAQGATSAPPASDQARSSDGYTFDITVIPKTMQWNLNGIRQGDTLSATIKWLDCPLDARTIRACAIDAFIGTFTSKEFALGIANANSPDEQGAGTQGQLSVIADTYMDDTGHQRTNRRFRGWVDKWQTEFAEDGEPVITLECTDNSRLFVQQPMPPALPLDMTKPIDQAVAQLLSNFPQFQGMSVQYFPTTDTPPVLKDVLLNTAYRPNLGPPVSKGGGAPTVQHSVWDYLVDVCGSIAHIIRVQGDVVIIQRVRSITSKAIPPRADDPFTGNRSVNGETLAYRRFILGRNLKKMTVTRNYTHQKPTNVEVRSTNTESKPLLLVARFPLAADRQVYAIPGDAQPQQNWRVITLAGIKDQATLQLVAQEYYEMQGRNEVEVNFQTRNLASFGGGNTDIDILDMQTGDAFELLVHRDDRTSSFTQIEKAQTIQAANVNLLKKVGFTQDFANAYAKAYTNIGLPTQFRLKKMTVDWDNDDGITIDITGSNYIEVRADKSGNKEPGANASDPNATTPAANNQPQGVNDNTQAGGGGAPPGSSLTTSGDGSQGYKTGQ